MIACAALALAAGCAGPPISAYVVPLDASFAARPDRVVSIVRGGGSGRLRVQTVSPSGRRRVLRGFDRYLMASRKLFAGADHGLNLEADVDQSGRWIVVGARATRYVDEGPEDVLVGSGEAVLAGTARGRVRQLQACPGQSLGGIHSLDGSRLAMSSCDGSKLMVRDLARRRARSIEVPMRAISRRPLTDVTLAGGYLAVTEYGPGGVPDVGLTIRVLRWPSLDPVYTLTGARVSYSFGFARDGTLVATRIPDGQPAFGPRPGPSPCLDTRLETVWLSPTEPVPHVLPGTPCEDEMSLHGGQVLFGRLVAPAAEGDAERTSR